MAEYSKATDANGTTRYKDGGKFVAADNVPENVKTVLADAADGTLVDELGDPVNTETDSDEGTGDEPAPSEADEPTQDESDADEEPANEPGDEPVKQATIEPTPTEQSDEGMGYKRSKGKTLSIFSNKPHETVKNVNGLMVPLTHEEYTEKTDGEIIAQLKKLKKL